MGCEGGGLPRGPLVCDMVGCARLGGRSCGPPVSSRCCCCKLLSLLFPGRNCSVIVAASSSAITAVALPWLCLSQDVVRINGPADPAQQLPNTLSLSVRGVSASALLAQLSSRLAASAGAACHSHGGPAISGVLAAMKVRPCLGGGGGG